MKPVYTNDTSAPRMRKGEFSTRVITEKAWIKFRKTFPEYKKMSWAEFQQLWADLAETIREEAITNPLGVKLGSFVGELKLQYLPYKFRGVAPKLSSELGEKSYYINLSEKGKGAKIKWERRQAVKFNTMLQFYAFDPTRIMNKMARAHISKNPNSLRISRNTLGGQSVWRSLLMKDKKNGKL